MKIAIFAVVSILLVSCQSKDVISADEARAAIRKFDEAWKHKNSGLVDSLLSPSYIYFTQSGGTFERKNVVNTASSPEYILTKMIRNQYDIRIEGNVAVVSTIWTGEGSYYGTPFNDRQRCSVTLIKKHGKIEILSEHCTPLQ
jgi:hypothetical protein